MAIPGTTSALVAAFVFGIVLNAASASLFLNVKGHGSSVFRDGKRLVLVVFLLSAALWAQADFITTLIVPTATASCQVGVLFMTIFDQLARFSVEQHLLWVINDGVKAGVPHYILQALLVVRFVMGAVFVGLSRSEFSEFNTVCVPHSSVLFVAIITVVLDAVVLVGLFSRAFMSRVFRKMGDGGQLLTRGKAVIAVLVGLVLWMGTSVPMLLGEAGGPYLLRSTIPAGSLAVLIFIVAASSASLMAPDWKRDQERTIPEAPSPRMIATSGTFSTSASTDYPPSRYEDLKGEQLRSANAFVQPREVPRPGQVERPPRAVPICANASAEQGFGGLPVQGALFPPMRAEAERPKPAALPQRSEQPKRSFFDSTKGLASAVTVNGKLAISNPVLQQGGSNPLDKVATTDLATAVQLSKQKRELVTPRSELLVPAETAVDSEQDLNRSAATGSRDIAALLSKDLRPDSETLASGFAKSTRSLPSLDELRRRSPRQTLPLDPDGESTQLLTKAPPVPLKSPSRPRPQQAMAPGPNPVIRPSRQRPPTPQPVIEPLKTPLQRRSTAGLPLHPRAKSVFRPSPSEAGQMRQATVLFVNNIVYNDPTFVASVMEDAKDRGIKTPLSSVTIPEVETARDQMPLIPQVVPLPEPSSEPPLTASSVLHRPRPIPRKSNAQDRENVHQTGHKKAKSLGNVTRRKSILQLNPGSPTTLPPLPPPPQLARVHPSHPNDTKGMTYSEKISFLFPAPNEPGQGNRRSSVPLVQGSFTDDSPTLTDHEARDIRSRDSKATASSVRTRSIFSVQEQEAPPELPVKPRLVPSVDKRASSPVLPVLVDPSSASTADHEDEMTTIGSVYSPQRVKQVGLAVHQARAIEVTRGDRTSPNNRATSAVTAGEEMIVMLDTSVVREIRQVLTQDGSGSPVKGAAVVEDTNSTRSSGPWHRRVGEKTLSFSGYSDKTGCRRDPPPTPLALSEVPTHAKQMAIAKAAEPSPLPSPEEALQTIQAQLQKYEHAGRTATESPGRQALLNDLEAEMGQQESRWLGMQNRFYQDSITTEDSSPAADSRRTSASVAEMSSEQDVSRNSSTRSIMSIYRRTRQASVAASMLSLTNDDDGMPYSSRASLWQRRLDAAHQEFIHTAGELDKRSRNFLRLSSNLGSPSPPDSDSSESEVQTRRNLADILARRAKEDEAKRAAAKKVLWTSPQRQEELSGLMWVRPEKPYYVSVAEPALPSLSVRPAQRKAGSALSIDSDQLWQKPVSDLPFNSSKLWSSPSKVNESEKLATSVTAPETEARNFYNPDIRRSQTISGRPLTQRPPRRSRKITDLPDIVEDPVPLPNKRDTLGIFRFPWGEKSDVPCVPQRSVVRTMPGTMSTGGVYSSVLSRSRELEQREYSSSIFDEYENEDDSSSMGSEADDDFDETTLCDIADLLQTHNVPSINSLIGASRDSGDSLLDQYMTDEQRDERARVASEEETEGLQMMPSPLPPKKIQALWEDDSLDEARGSHGKGLLQPRDWHHRHDEITQTIRAKPRASQQSDSVDSYSLWAPEPLKTMSSNNKSPMWTPADSPTKQASSESSLPENTSAYESPGSPVAGEIPTEAPASRLPLWQALQKEQRGENGAGLPQPHNWVSLTGVSSTAPAKRRPSSPSGIESPDLSTVSKLAQSPANGGLDRSTATALWTSTTAKNSERDWISVKAARIAGSSSEQLLWSALTSPKELVTSGLFDLNSSRSDFRTTPRTPAALDIHRASRSPEREPLSRLNSTTLWARGAEAVAEKVRIPKARFSPNSLETTLWPQALSPNENTEPGLYRNSARTVFKTTLQAPAALEMSREPRSLEEQSLDQLATTSPWALEAKSRSGRNWLSAHKVTTRAREATPEQWHKALDQAVIASYPVLRISSHKTPVEAALAARTAGVAEAVSKRPFDVSKRHPVFAASSLTSSASVIHPAAAGYTTDVASWHPVFLGPGAGKAVHPAVRPETVAVSDMAEQATTAGASAAPVFRGSRIAAMASMFEASAQDAPIRRSVRISAQSFAEPAAIPSRPASSHSQVEKAQPTIKNHEPGMDAALLAQIEALEQERIFAEQWAAGAFEPSDDVPDSAGGLPFSSPVAAVSNAETPSTTNSKAKRLTQELPTSASESSAPLSLEVKTSEEDSNQQQPLTAEQIDEDLFIPKDVSPAKPLAPLSASPSLPKTPTAVPSTPPKATGWLSSLSTRFGAKSPKLPPSSSQSNPENHQSQEPQVSQISQVQQSDTAKSIASAVSEPGTIQLTNSLAKAGSESGQKVVGSKIEFRFG